MRTYTIETIGRTLFTVTDKSLAEIFFEQNKEKYNYLSLMENVEVNGNIHRESLEISRK